MSSWNNNVKKDEANSFGIFAGKAQGVSTDLKNVKSLGPSYMTFEKGFAMDTQFVGTINVQSNPVLKRLAESGQARMLLKIKRLTGPWTMAD